MYCHNCGKQASNNAQNCPACGVRLSRGAAIAGEISSRAKVASQDAFQAFKTFATDPVGGLQPAFLGLGPERALAAGIVFAVVFDLCFAIGLGIGSRHYLGWLNVLLYGSDSGFVQFLKSLVVGMVPPLALFASCALARVMFRGTGATAGDVFTAGAALLPSGFLVLIGSLLGVGNVEVVAVLAIFALSYTILMLYSGCTGIAMTSQAGAALAVPVMLIASSWLTKVILTAIW